MRARGTQAGPHRPPARQAEAEPLGLDKSGRQSERARNAGLVGFFGFLLRILFFPSPQALTTRKGATADSEDRAREGTFLECTLLACDCCVLVQCDFSDCPLSYTSHRSRQVDSDCGKGRRLLLSLTQVNGSSQAVAPPTAPLSPPC